MLPVPSLPIMAEVGLQPGGGKVEVTRREFIGSVSAAAVGTRMRPENPVVGDDPLGVRGDFPVVEEGVYLDSAYIGPSPRQAVEAIRAFAEGKARNPLGLGALVEEADAVRRKFARLIGATEPEIGVLYATSEGENIVARALDLGPGDNVVIDDLHFSTTYVLYQHLAEARGVEIRIVPSRGGAVPVDAFADHIDERTRLVSVAWVSHQNGYHHDLAALAQLAHAQGSYLYADANPGNRDAGSGRERGRHRLPHHGDLQMAAGWAWRGPVLCPGGTPGSRGPRSLRAPPRIRGAWAGTVTDYTTTGESMRTERWPSNRSTS